MPYNTRRKSLSLPSLGIHVPVTHAARAAAAAHRTVAASQQPAQQRVRSSSATDSSSAPSTAMDSHQTKKIKRSHGDDALSPSSPRSPSRLSLTSPRSAARKLPAGMKLETTPPPSPPADRPTTEKDDSDGDAMDTSSDTPLPIRKIDLSSINDTIVEAVIVRLDAEANRPHLVKELAAVLIQQLQIVQQSANPCAIISSRLSSYLKRTCWNASNPCPLAKELETVHPRRTYFYLTTVPHPALPDTSISALLSQAQIITPPLSSNASGSVEAEDDSRRRELSPSPEVDLRPEFDEMDDDVSMPGTPIGSFSGHLPTAPRAPAGQRSSSPPLEKDEREFTQTAEGLQGRKLSSDMLGSISSAEHATALYDPTPRSSDDGLFGGAVTKTTTLSVPAQLLQVASPAMRPAFSLGLKKEGEVDSWTMLEFDRSPENVDLDELDGLMTGY